MPLNAEKPGTDVRVGSTEGRLLALLEADRMSNTIVAERKGKINRTHYARFLNCHRSNLNRYDHIFTRYERELGIATGPLRHLAAMREWLLERYETGALVLRDGKIDRSAFMAHFNLRGGNFLTRYAPIREMFEELDLRSQREAYQPAAIEDEVERVRALLASNPRLNRDRRTISRIALAQAAQIPVTRFAEGPLADLLSAQEAGMKVEIEASRIDPFLHGRVFPFSDLSPLWPTSFLQRVGIRFKQVAAGRASKTSKQNYLALHNLLAWIAISVDPACRAIVAGASRHGRVESADNWEDALYAYRDFLVGTIASEGASPASIDVVLGSLRSVLDGLATGQVVPAMSIPLAGVKNAARLAGHLRSVAEVGSSYVPVGDKDYVGFAKDRLMQAVKSIGAEVGADDSTGFIQGLASELHKTKGLPADTADAIRLVLERRLATLQRHAALIVDGAMVAYDRGRDLLSRARIDTVAFEREYTTGDLNKHQHNQLVRRHFPRPGYPSELDAEQGIANLLALVEERHQGILPSASFSKGNPYGHFFACRLLECGGIRRIEPLLGPDPTTLAAVLTLYLIESGANVSVGRTLDRACVEPGDETGYRRITGHKARAQGKPIIVDLPGTSPAVRAMEWLVRSNAKLVPAAGADGDRLFLMRIGVRAQLMQAQWYTAWFKGFVASVPEFAAVELLPHMIRPSVLLHAALSDDGRLKAGLAIAQHGLAVTQGYQQKWPTRLLYDENVRRFQTAFETLVLSGVDQAATKLGISPAQFEARLGNLRATGLGTYCKDQRGRPGERSPTCSTVDCWNDCPNLMIVAEVEAVASLQLWQASLRAARPDWERDRMERWDQVWLPWLCLTDAVEEKMARGPMVKIWNAARERASLVSSSAGYVPPRPW